MDYAKSSSAIFGNNTEKKITSMAPCNFGIWQTTAAEDRTIVHTTKVPMPYGIGSTLRKRLKEETELLENEVSSVFSVRFPKRG